MSGEEEVSRDRPAEGAPSETNEPVERRGVLGWLASVGLIGGLAAAYGTFGAYIARFLFPARPTDRGWMFVIDLAGMREGDSLVYKTPAGAPVNITRRSADADATAFVALSSTCPHLGCQVHWQSQNNRYFCPCHNGVFDPSGKATGGSAGGCGTVAARVPAAGGGRDVVHSGAGGEDGGGGGRSNGRHGPVQLAPLAQGGGRPLQAHRRGPGHDPCLYPDTLTEAAGLRAGRPTTGLAGVRRS